MKDLLSGVAIAALVATSLPAWAQTNSPDQTRQAPSSGATRSSPSASGPSTGMSAPSAGKATGRAEKHAAAKKRGGRSPEDNMAGELNRQELERVTQGGGQTTTGSGATEIPNTGAAGVGHKTKAGAAAPDASGNRK